MKRLLLFLALLLGSFFLYWLSSQLLTPSITVAAAQESKPKTLDSKEISSCPLNATYPEAVQQWCDLITQYASQNQLDPNLIAALIWQESGGDPAAISRDGAVGLMQVMPSDGIAATFQCVNGPCFADRPSTAALMDPEFNIAWGTGFLHDLKIRKGTLREALRAYGPANVEYEYADIVLSIYASH